MGKADDLREKIDELRQNARSCFSEAEGLREDAAEADEAGEKYMAQAAKLEKKLRELLLTPEDKAELARRRALEKAYNHPDQLKLDV